MSAATRLDGLLAYLADAQTHRPCCSTHDRHMTCAQYRRTHYVEVRPCCAIDAAVLAAEQDQQPEPPTMSDDVVEFVQGRRRDCLRALRACTDPSADYWRWQGHAELARQLLERIGAEVPR